MKKIFIIATALLILNACKKEAKLNEENKTVKNENIEISDGDIGDAYLYLLGRALVLRQENLDFGKEGFKWNKLIYRAPGGVDWANPNLDVAYTEAWIAVDEQTCVILEIPKITGRYYTWHMLNGWGETILNINERTFAQKPYGKYALCLKGSNPKIPDGALRIDLPVKTSRVLARVELGKNIQEAIRIQHEFKLTETGKPKIDPIYKTAPFTNDKLPGAELFDDANGILNSEADINEGMEPMQIKVKQVEALVKSGQDGKNRVEKIIRKRAMAEFMALVINPGPKQNGWCHPENIGNYGSHFKTRTLINLGGIWANNQKEATYYTRTGNDGSTTYTQTFLKNELPQSKVKYFWSVICVDAKEFKVIPNSIKRYLLNNQSPLKFNTDGSLTIVYSSKKPQNLPETNWIPTPEGKKYNLTFRYYGPAADIINGEYFPPDLIKQ
ncbi:hypothetical protein EV144_106377 [Flavobacterium sp. 270]|uniref:DUF1214 domain-containing protein n=1 Tax=Flavobacterium sp. 270 TaxID=2512114 RepID=UPI001065A0F7|nr:DUF1214 domain-containing protein [Flavobacterium sp. 270]TDW46703.1 hypothetical protein EV144_106377 [Flavobacterium sp. 270]